MNLIADTDGVKVVVGEAEVIANLDFNFVEKRLHELNHRKKSWDVNIYDGPRPIGRANFSAYQFMADGVERRTISLKHIELSPYHRGKGLSYDVARFVLDTVKEECDKEWQPVTGKPVIFIEKRNLKVREKDKTGAIDFFRKIATQALGIQEGKKPSPDQNITVTVIGEDISIQLIQSHLQRSAGLDD